MCKPLEVQHPTVSRWETGERAPRPEDVAAYMMAIGAPADLRERLVDMARDTTSKRWLAMNTAGVPEHQSPFAAMLEIERTAWRITHIAPLLMPGMTQRDDYARSVFVGAGVPANQIDVRVALRIGRQAVLTRRDPLWFRAFIWEPVLHARLAGMDDQLQHLLDLAERPNVDIRIIPADAEWNPGWEGPFSLAEFPDESGRGPVVQLENKVSALYLDDPDEVTLYQKDCVRAEEVAISPESTKELIADVINSKETTG